jgi:hypothetical protein
MGFRHDEAVIGGTRFARLLVLALVIGLGIANLYWSVAQWTLSDAGAYWEAALRLRAGEELYPAVADLEASEVYRYAPWFAWLTIPFTFLPIEVAAVLWSAVLVAASVVAVIPLARERAWLAAAFFFPILIGISAVGNVQPLIVAALVHGLERRSGPLWIALTASLKVVPALFAVVYLGRRQWWRFAASVLLTLLLVAPMLLFDLSNYVTDPAEATFLMRWPPIWVAALVLGVGVTVWLAKTRHAWLAAGTAAALALPRFFVYDVTFLLPGTTMGAEDPPHDPSRSAESPSNPG